MAMKSVLVVLGVLLFPPSGVLAQPATSAEPPDVPADVEEWMRTMRTGAWSRRCLASPTRTFCRR